MLFSLLVGLSVGAPLLVAPPAFAAGGNDDNLAAALQKFDAGKKAFEGGQFEEALSAFKGSLELLPSPNTRMYIGRCYRALGKIASAYTELKLAAVEAQDRLVASGEKRYSATRDTANQEAADLEAKVPRLTVAVPANPPQGFVVKVDGKELPTAAWGIASETNPGAVVVEATGPRLVPFKQTVNLAEGAKARVDIPMERLPTATVAVKLKNLPSGLAMTLDGQPIDAGGLAAPRDLDVGAHSLVVSAPGYVTFHWDKQLADKQVEVVEVTLAADPSARGGSSGTPKWLFFAAAGTAVAAAGAGTAVGLIATNQQNQQIALNKLVRDPNVKSSIQSQATVADVLFIGSGVVGIGAVVLLFTTKWRSDVPADQQPPVSFAPWIGPSGGGVGAQGSF